MLNLLGFGAQFPPQISFPPFCEEEAEYKRQKRQQLRSCANLTLLSLLLLLLFVCIALMFWLWVRSLNHLLSSYNLRGFCSMADCFSTRVVWVVAVLFLCLFLFMVTLFWVALVLLSMSFVGWSPFCSVCWSGFCCCSCYFCLLVSDLFIDCSSLVSACF